MGARGGEEQQQEREGGRKQEQEAIEHQYEGEKKLGRKGGGGGTGRKRKQQQRVAPMITDEEGGGGGGGDGNEGSRPMEDGDGIGTVMVSSGGGGLFNGNKGGAGYGAVSTIDIDDEAGMAGGRYSHDENVEGEGEGGGGGGGGDCTPSWVAISQGVAADTEAIRVKMAELVKSHSHALMPSFDDSNAYQARIEELTGEITQLIREGEKKVKGLTKHEDRRGGRDDGGWSSSSSSTSRSEKMLIQNAQRSAAMDLQELSVLFRKKQKDYIQRLRLQEEQAVASVTTSLGWLSAANSNSSSSGVGGGGGGGGGAVMMDTKKQQQRREQKMPFFFLGDQDREQVEGGVVGGLGGGGRTRSGRLMLQEMEYDDPGFSEIQMTAVKEAEGTATEREREIQQIVDSVNELALILKDLSVLVIDQGSVLDRIDYNIEKSAVIAEKSVRQLQRSEVLQKKDPLIACIMIFFVLCVIALILLVFKKTLFGGGGGRRRK
ncbi:hypothetical protein CBR_g50624 [Chara braunii]|uniref:t-SNARE coiled-coil homology domain-containing protein n=1 Tax=Chara braunii TaxID=69332 RepID=A0A388M767_CHABU|nr:hypothetical protein CBR_g50624 [Chara braunii]|eukprot:GBG90376.1 hypothetical protein CBR_g50624 [Chara braunii]